MLALSPYHANFQIEIKMSPPALPCLLPFLKRKRKTERDLDKYSIVYMKESYKWKVFFVKRNIMSQSQIDHTQRVKLNQTSIFFKPQHFIKIFFLENYFSIFFEDIQCFRYELKFNRRIMDRKLIRRSKYILTVETSLLENRLAK